MLAGSTFGLSSLMGAGSSLGLNSEVLPRGPSHDSCPFMGLDPHLFMGMGLPALQDSRTSIMVLGVRHSCKSRWGWAWVGVIGGG